MYVLDANIFIQAKNAHYGLDFCPAFWDWIIERHHDGTLCSIDEVLSELRGKSDELSEWAKDNDNIFHPADQERLDALPLISQWANAQDYDQSAIGEFLGCADYHLVAHAFAHQYTVVTYERESTSRKRIKIPNACHSLDIKCDGIYAVLRRHKARFVLG
ncbi:MAG: DUF4411 family protein [Haliangiales bacterium]